jgi:peptidyl-prolyl cis-trans isomerase D
MLTTIRAKTGSWIVKVLFGLLIAAFGVWGIGDIFRGDHARDPVAEVGNTIDLKILPSIPLDHVVKYSQIEFQRDLKRALDQFSRAQNFQISAAQFAQLGGAAQVTAQAVNRGLLQVYADRLNLAMPMAAAIKSIQQDPSFQNELGQFDRNRFEAVLRDNNMSEAGYVEDMRANMVNRALYAAAFGGVNGPEALARETYFYQLEQRTAEVLSIPAASIKDVTAPDDAALVAYHKDHADKYQSPEYRAATVLHLSPADFTGEVTVTDQEIADEYEARKAEFGTPDQRDVEQVVVQDKAMADKIETAVKGGKAFADAVKEATGGAPVALGKVTKAKLPAEIADKVFALSLSAVSEPLTSAFGIHIVHVLGMT